MAKNKNTGLWVLLASLLAAFSAFWFFRKKKNHQTTSPTKAGSIVVGDSQIAAPMGDTLPAGWDILNNPVEDHPAAVLPKIVTNVQPMPMREDLVINKFKAPPSVKAPAMPLAPPRKAKERWNPHANTTNTKSLL